MEVKKEVKQDLKKAKQKVSSVASEGLQALEKADEKLNVSGCCKQCLNDVKGKVDDALGKKEN